jgi:transcriptional regulator with XRE-family HTH domain
MSADITANSLKEWRKKEGLTQTDLGQMIGLDKYAITTIETGRRQISAPEQRLLKLLIHGEPPFPSAQNPYDPRIDFTAEEWTIIDRIAKREGYHSARPWLVQKIRDCLAMRREYPQQQATQFEQIPAEDPSPYVKKANGDVGHSG